MKLFDAVRKQGGDGRIKNRAGWLYAAIVHDYAAADSTKPSANAPASPPSPSVTIEASPLTPSPAAVAFEAFWGGLSESERDDFEAAAVAAAPAFLQKQYHDGKAAKGSLWRVTRERILLAHFPRPVGPARG